MMGASDISPTLIGYLSVSKMFPLEGIFSRGEHLNLDPTDILSAPSGLLTMNGHHRLAQALLHNVEIPNRIYMPGDTYEMFLGPAADTIPVPIDERFIREMEQTRRYAVLAGHRTYLDLYSHSFKIDWNSFPFNQMQR